MYWLTYSCPHSTAGCWATWCSCVFYSKNKQRLRNLQQQGAPLPGGGERYDDHCRIYGALLILTGYAWALHVCLWCLMRYHQFRLTDTYPLSPARWSDSHSRRNSWALWYSWGRLWRLPHRMAMPPVFAHAGTPRNRVGGGQFRNVKL